MKATLRRVLLGKKTVPEYAVIGITEPQAAVRVQLKGSGFNEDVTFSHTVASLRPLRVALSLRSELADRLMSATNLELGFYKTSQPAHPLGIARLLPVDRKNVGDLALCIMRVTGSVNYCVSQIRYTAYELYRKLANRRRGTQYNHQMSGSDLRSFFVLYTMPRPVALVSFESEQGGNIFPMDLIGPASSPYFLLALHTTSPSLDLILANRRIAVSRVPIELTSQVYELGKNHRVQSIAWDSVPVEMMASPKFDIPVCTASLGILELQLEGSFELGSHTLLVTRVETDLNLRSGLRMCHVQGFCSDRIKTAGPAS